MDQLGLNYQLDLLHLLDQDLLALAVLYNQLVQILLDLLYQLDQLDQCYLYRQLDLSDHQMHQPVQLDQYLQRYLQHLGDLYHLFRQLGQYNQSDLLLCYLHQLVLYNQLVQSLPVYQ